MKFKQINNEAEKTFALIFDKGDEVTATLLDFAKEKELSASHFTGIGAFSDCTLGFFERESKDYRRIPIREQVEVVSLTGNIVLTKDGEYRLHAHVVVGKDDGRAYAGHLLEAHIWPTLELVLIESPGYLSRRIDPETDLPLIAID
jgi:hypothetical protein